MKKSLVKFIVGTSKSNKNFEERLANIFSNSISGESALVMIAYGWPIKIKDVNYSKLIEFVQNECSSNVKVTKITDVRLSDEGRITVRFLKNFTKYFSSEQTASEAIEKKRGYDGYSSPDENHKYPATFEGESDSMRIDADELEGIVTIERL